MSYAARALLGGAFASIATLSLAQGTIVVEGLDPAFDSPDIETEQTVEAETAPKGVMMRALDKVSGEIVDFTLEPEQTKQMGLIQVTLEECRFPVQNPSGDAFAFVHVRNAGDADPVFSGWMIASSPALNSLDHARYDVWPLRCITS